LQVSSDRVRPAVTAGLAVLVTLSLVLLTAVARRIESSRIATASVLAAPPAPEPATRPEPSAPFASDCRVERVSLGRGGTLASALDELAIPDALRPALLRVAGESVELRRLSPRTGVSATWNAQGRLVALSLREEAERFLRLRLGGADGETSIRSEWIELPVITTQRTSEGIIESSVAQAFADTDHGTYLTAAFADVVQWDVDLLVDPRPGDRVRLVYEVRHLGELPADVPAYDSRTGAAGDELAPGRILAASYRGRIAGTTAFWVADSGGRGSYYDADGRPLRKTFLKSPLNYRRISSGFSNARRNPVTRRVVPHHGVDFAAAPGTPVVATADGRVASAGWDGPLGRAIRVRHGSEYTTIYGHLRGYARGIRRGVEVKQNQVIGYVGSSGRATGPHLHYTMKHGGRAINPLRFQNPPSEPLPVEMRPLLELAKQRWMPLLDLPRDEIELVERGYVPGSTPPPVPGV
jgi:murein DD-endopeptidase MepM/ murein hydrolase activator NlpD